ALPHQRHTPTRAPHHPLRQRCYGALDDLGGVGQDEPARPPRRRLVQRHFGGGERVDSARQELLGALLVTAARGDLSLQRERQAVAPRRLLRQDARRLLLHLLEVAAGAEQRPPLQVGPLDADRLPAQELALL